MIHGKIHGDSPTLLHVNEVHPDRRIRSRFIGHELVCLGVQLCVRVLIEIRCRPPFRQAVAQPFHDVLHRFVSFRPV